MKKGGGISKEEALKKKARKISIIEGSFSTAEGGFGGAYITPFAIAIGSSNSQIALLSSFTGLLGPISQWFGSKAMEKQSRKKIVVNAILLQCLMWIPIIFIAFLYWKKIWQSSLPILLISFFSAYVIFANLAGPPWFSWMGDIVDEKKRGRYFSKRNRIGAAIAVITTLISAYFLDFFKAHNFLLFGFAIFFFLAMIARLIARELFKKQYEPKLKLDKGYYFSFWKFIKKAPHNNSLSVR